jgi:chromosome segregation ATPase
MKSDLLARLDAGYTRPIATPLEFAEAATAIRELQAEIEVEEKRFNQLSDQLSDDYAKQSILNSQLREGYSAMSKDWIEMQDLNIEQTALIEKLAESLQWSVRILGLEDCEDSKCIKALQQYELWKDKK